MVAARYSTLWPAAACCFLSLLVLGGCGSMATKQKFYEPLTAELRTGEYESVAQKLEAARTEGKYGKKDRFLYYLDAGLTWHYAQRYDSSILRLSEAEQTADDLYTKSISKAILANTLLNDNALEYAGEDYEVLYTNLISALNYLALGMFDDAFVEVRRAGDKLELLEQKYVEAHDRLAQQTREDSSAILVDYKPDAVRFNNSAFVRYLSMHMYAADGLYDDAEIDYSYLQSAFRSQPHIYPFDPPDIDYALDDMAMLSVVALTGLAPVKEALNLRIRADKQLNLLTIIYDDGNDANTVFANYPLPDGLGDMYAKLSIPQLKTRPSQIASVKVIVNGSVLGYLQLVEDIELIAQETFAARQGVILWRTVLRTIGKSLAAHKLKKKVDDGGLGGWLGKLAVDIVHDATENADLRCAHMLPQRVHVGDFRVNPGDYDIRLEFLDQYGAVLATRDIPAVRIRAGDFNLVPSVCLR
ncbi:MAG: hypothetical protein KOO62_06715 [candidate division Zixibacteria bacterium]|nr:hypothetical protein [candidate division Zixibacteria bacterium]